MALMICPECGGQVSDKAHTCPHCGYPIEELMAQGGLYRRFIEIREQAESWRIQ